MALNNASTRCDGLEHDELLKRLQVDVGRCAENAAQREDECGHGGFTAW